MVAPSYNNHNMISIARKSLLTKLRRISQSVIDFRITTYLFIVNILCYTTITTITIFNCYSICDFEDSITFALRTMDTFLRKALIKRLRWFEKKQYRRNPNQCNPIKVKRMNISKSCSARRVGFVTESTCSRGVQSSTIVQPGRGV